MIRIAQLNLNGARACHTKGLGELLSQASLDILCAQETRCMAHELPETLAKSAHLPHMALSPAVKPGYAGTLLASRHPLLERSTLLLDSQEHLDEGRITLARVGKLWVASAYFPSGSAGEHRHESKLRFLKAFTPFAQALLALAQSHGMEAIICADANIARSEIDIKNWKGNVGKSGFTEAERAWLESFLAMGWRDTHRELAPGLASYTWWSQRGGAREKDVGWRIDYQFCTPGLANAAKSFLAPRLPVISDHAPLIIDYDFALF